TIRLSADTSALTDSLSKIAEEMTAMKDAVFSSAAAMGANLDASAKKAQIKLNLPCIFGQTKLTNHICCFRQHFSKARSMGFSRFLGIFFTGYLEVG
ncbi:hypothetical protein, partial [Succinimonas sp.]|uniref:hypothetical protein n=1 Tax=Succinimonas sp. TaxID=1936151 RepID=UPI003863D3BD